MCNMHVQIVYQGECVPWSTYTFLHIPIYTLQYPNPLQTHTHTHHTEVQRGRGRLPVADYSLATQVEASTVAEEASVLRRLGGEWAVGHAWWGEDGVVTHAQGVCGVCVGGCDDGVVG